jgi:hypothetical protein
VRSVRAIAELPMFTDARPAEVPPPRPAFSVRPSLPRPPSSRAGLISRARPHPWFRSRAARTPGELSAYRRPQVLERALAPARLSDDPKPLAGCRSALPSGLGLPLDPAPALAMARYGRAALPAAAGGCVTTRRRECHHTTAQVSRRKCHYYFARLSLPQRAGRGGQACGGPAAALAYSALARSPISLF